MSFHPTSQARPTDLPAPNHAASGASERSPTQAGVGSAAGSSGSAGRCLASAGLVCWVKGQASATGEPRDKYRAAPETKAFARTILRAGDRNRPTARPRCSMLSEQPQHRTTSLPLARRGRRPWLRATGEPRDKYRAVPETKAFARTILRAGDRPTARPRCSMLSEQPQHRTTSLPPPARRRLRGLS